MPDAPSSLLNGVRVIVAGAGLAGLTAARTPDGPPPAWTFYFGIDDIDVAATAISGNGGTIHYGPAEVPGDFFIIVASDPQGALFGLVGPRKT